MPPRYYEGVAWIGAYLLSRKRIESWPKKSSQATSFCHAVSTTQYIGGASKSISFDFGNAGRTLDLIDSSHFKIVDFEKPCEKSLRRFPWGFGSRMLNMREPFVD